MDYEQAAGQMMGSVGATIHPRYPGVGASFAPRYLGRVGAPVNAVDPAQLMAAQKPIDYSSTIYTAGDVSYFGLGVTAVPAGATVNIQVNPQRPFEPQRLATPSTVIGLLILSANIAGTNMFSNRGGMPVELFSEVSTFPQIEWITIEPSTGIQLEVQNITLGALNFMGGFYGTQLRR